MTQIRKPILVAACAAALVPVLLASGTVAWDTDSYADFSRGRLEGVSLSRDGRLTLAPRLDTVLNTEQPVVWSMARATDGTLYAATGHRGRVYRIGKDGASQLLWTAAEPEVFALALDRSGALYAATAPNGKVYRIAADGKAAEYFDPHARYIWSLAVSPDGALFVGASEGKVFRVTAAATGELYYETGQSHVTSLAIDAQNRLLAGTEPNGILYRIPAKDKAFVLYDASLPEIRSIVPASDGTVYAVALGGAVARQVQAAAQQTQSSGASSSGLGTQVTTVTVEAQSIGPGPELKIPASGAAQAAATTPQVTSTMTPIADTSGVERSAVYRINPDNTVETLWTSKEENAYDLLPLRDRILISTDTSGRIYSLGADRRVTLLLETSESQATRLLLAGDSVLAATGNMGRVVRMGEAPGKSGSYESPARDAGSVARWGALSWRATVPAGCAVAFRTRSGNSAKPDRAWSDWSAPLTTPGAAVTSPNARFLQWKAELSGPGGVTPSLDGVTLAFLPQNSAPVVRSINVSMQPAVPTASTKTSASSSSGAYTVTATDSSDSAASSSQALTRSTPQQMTLVWAADDPDGDKLVYSVYFRPEDETRWMLLRGDLHEATITVDGDILADGKYYFRVVASDRESNTATTARETELVSPAVLIDNTPPTVTVTATRYAGAAAHVEFDASDATSTLRHAEYSLDAGPWVPLPSADGVIDSPREHFSVDLAGLAPGEHLLVLRAADSTGNTGLAKVLLK